MGSSSRQTSALLVTSFFLRIQTASIVVVVTVTRDEVRCVARVAYWPWPCLNRMARNRIYTLNSYPQSAFLSLFRSATMGLLDSINYIEALRLLPNRIAPKE